MPELPELEALRSDLSGHLEGREVAGCELASVSALKTYDPPLEALVGRQLGAVERRGKYLCLATEDERRSPSSAATAEATGRRTGPSGELWLVLHLARGGWIRWHDQVPSSTGRPRRGPLALRVRLDTRAGFDVTEAGTQKRLALWVVAHPKDLPQIAGLGPDPLDPALTPEAFSALLERRTATLKTLLTDQRILAGVGNAYSDEILHAARLSPFRPAGRLDHQERRRLFQAMTEVLHQATARAEGLRASELKGHKRQGLRVHGRAGEPCPVCGDTVLEVSFAERSLQYCPRCQTGGKVLADRRLSRLLR